MPRATTKGISRHARKGGNRKKSKSNRNVINTYDKEEKNRKIDKAVKEEENSMWYDDYKKKRKQKEEEQQKASSRRTSRRRRLGNGSIHNVNSNENNDDMDVSIKLLEGSFLNPEFTFTNLRDNEFNYSHDLIY